MQPQFITLPRQGKDITGQVFGRLLALGPIAIENNRVMWLCRCACGKEVEISSNHLRTGNTKSCGCLKPERIGDTHRKHGLRNTPEYDVWAGMLQRCTNPNHVGYANYGGRGIRVCERWKSFENFIIDMGRRPDANYEIDRINNDGNYEPNNCRWSTSAAQRTNKRTNRYVVWQGKTYTLTELASEVGIDFRTLGMRLDRGWSIEQAVMRPAKVAKSNE